MTTTPQVFIGGKRVGGYDDLRRFLGKRVADPKATSYRPVIALFAMTALMALAASYAVSGTSLTVRAAEWFISFSMIVLALLKLQNVETFSTMFLNYDLLAKRWVPYGYIYPFAEGLAGVLMIAGVLTWLSVPIALFIGTVGAVSVFKAVYIDKRELKCACVGGSSNVPLGFVSLTENLMMIAMAIWMACDGVGVKPSWLAWCRAALCGDVAAQPRRRPQSMQMPAPMSHAGPSDAEGPLCTRADGAHEPHLAMTGALGPYPMAARVLRHRVAAGHLGRQRAARHERRLDADGARRAEPRLRSSVRPARRRQGVRRGMLMGMARRPLGNGTLQFKAMVSPDPLMGPRGYPLLLASGETANGATG